MKKLFVAAGLIGLGMFLNTETAKKIGKKAYRLGNIGVYKLNKKVNEKL